MTWLFALGPVAIIVVLGLSVVQQVTAQIQAVLP